MKQSLCSISKFIQENRVYGCLQAKTAIYKIESDFIEANVAPRRGHVNCTNAPSVALLPRTWNDDDSAADMRWCFHFLGKFKPPKECKEIVLLSGPTQSN